MFRFALRSFANTARTSALQRATPRMAVATFNGARFYSGAPELTRELITERVLETLEGFDKVDKSALSETASFSKDLKLDSLDIVEVVMALEEEFSIEVSDEQADEIKTVKQAIDMIAAQEDAV